MSDSCPPIGGLNHRTHRPIPVYPAPTWLFSLIVIINSALYEAFQGMRGSQQSMEESAQAIAGSVAEKLLPSTVNVQL